MPPICDVKRELYLAATEAGKSPIVFMSYTDPQGLRRKESRSVEVSNDWADNHRERFSDDNGRTWGAWQPAGHSATGQNPTRGDLTMEGGFASGGELDPVSGKRVAVTLQRIVKGDTATFIDDLFRGVRRFCDHCFYQVSDGAGVPCAPLRMFRYEDGPDFDPENWAEDRYWRTNEMYPGSLAVLPNGSVIAAMTVPVPCDDPLDKGVTPVFPADFRAGCTAGAMTFVGRWSHTLGDFEWRRSNKVAVPLHKSSRGLVELAITRLRDERLLMVMRGSNVGLDAQKAPGNKWISASRDGGLTWSPVTDFRYDTGESWYSPASISYTFRSSKTGKLYFLGNICDTPTHGNGPRYPMQIAEIDEDTVTLRKDTVTVIDRRDPATDAECLQLSNFCLLENRETMQLEIYMPRYGAKGGAWSGTGDQYKYTLTF